MFGEEKGKGEGKRNIFGGGKYVILYIVYRRERERRRKKKIFGEGKCYH